MLASSAGPTHADHNVFDAGAADTNGVTVRALYRDES
jgi:hypothetical protein